MTLEFEDMAREQTALIPDDDMAQRQERTHLACSCKAPKMPIGRVAAVMQHERREFTNILEVNRSRAETALRDEMIKETGALEELGDVLTDRIEAVGERVVRLEVSGAPAATTTRSSQADAWTAGRTPSETSRPFGRHCRRRRRRYTSSLVRRAGVGPPSRR